MIENDAEFRQLHMYSNVKPRSPSQSKISD